MQYIQLHREYFNIIKLDIKSKVRPGVITPKMLFRQDIFQSMIKNCFVESTRLSFVYWEQLSVPEKKNYKLLNAKLQTTLSSEHEAKYCFDKSFIPPHLYDQLVVEKKYPE